MPPRHERPLTLTLAHLLGRSGAAVTDRYAAAIALFEVKPKHVGLLAAIAERNGAPQLDLARTLGVAPSLVVALADHLEQRGAIRRTRDPADRRRQQLTLTPTGEALLRRCTEAAEELDDELATRLSEADREHLRRLLALVMSGLGLTPDRHPPTDHPEQPR